MILLKECLRSEKLHRYIVPGVRQAVLVLILAKNAPARPVLSGLAMVLLLNTTATMAVPIKLVDVNYERNVDVCFLIFQACLRDQMTCK